jgi:hypothetical protein
MRDLKVQSKRLHRSLCIKDVVCPTTRRPTIKKKFPVFLDFMVTYRFSTLHTTHIYFQYACNLFDAVLLELQMCCCICTSQPHSVPVNVYYILPDTSAYLHYRAWFSIVTMMQNPKDNTKCICFSSTQQCFII